MPARVPKCAPGRLNARPRAQMRAREPECPPACPNVRQGIRACKLPDWLPDCFLYRELLLHTFPLLHIRGIEMKALEGDFRLVEIALKKDAEIQFTPKNFCVKESLI